MNISFAVSVCNELPEIKRLLEYLIKVKTLEEEVVVLYDTDNGSKEVEELLKARSADGELSWHKASLSRNFADFKNNFFKYCKGDYIFQLDADEECRGVIEFSREIVKANSDIDFFMIPRENKVIGHTAEDARRWNWKVDNQERINWCDWQGRLYKNDYPRIQWKNKVHEKLSGNNLKYTFFPIDPNICLVHHKTIVRQTQQNEFYNQL